VAFVPLWSAANAVEPAASVQLAVAVGGVVAGETALTATALQRSVVPSRKVTVPPGEAVSFESAGCTVAVNVIGSPYTDEEPDETMAVVVSCFATLMVMVNVTPVPMPLVTVTLTVFVPIGPGDV